MSDSGDPMDCSPPGSSVHGIFQARVLEWGAIAFSKGRSLFTYKFTVDICSSSYYNSSSFFSVLYASTRASLIALLGKNMPAMQETRVLFLGWKDLRGRKWQPTPVFLLGESHGQRSLACYSPWGHKNWTQLSD